MDARNSSTERLGGLLVSKMVTDHLQQPRFMYREKRTRPEDSGWRIFTGMESEEYLEDPANCAIYRPDTVIAIDSSIGLLLQSGIGSVWEKNDDNFWERVTDFPLEDDFETKQALPDGWEISINNLFERKTGEDEVYFTTGDKSVRVSVWTGPESKETLVARVRAMMLERDDSYGAVLEQFEFGDMGVLLLGYTVVEHDERRAYSVLYGSSVIDGACASAAIYFDDPADQEWAVATWRSIRPAATDRV